MTDIFSMFSDPNPSGQFTFIEPFCGSAAVSYGLLGARRLAPYMGSKLPYVKQLQELMHLQPENVTAIHLMDSGEWGTTLHALHEQGLADEVADLLDEWGRARKTAFDAGEDTRYWTDDRELFERLMASSASTERVERAAAHLFLQVRAFNGKPVSIQDGQWKSPGFDPEYRDNVKVTSTNTNNRGWATPRWKMAERIRQNQAPMARVPVLARQHDHTGSKCPLLWETAVGTPRVVYMDPPYQGTTKYADEFSREHVLNMARGLYAQGNTSVYISEGEPLEELVAEGWDTTPLQAPGKGRRAWKDSKVREWVTYHRSEA